ncbi:MAG: GuaB3 family IMP dehydrogenase-related protein [Candidatus Omnitrophica bacterium]|nr:GuaB3 family IMP dehydrogenase-related protein [Candidatus Omnitrophota bacterium]MCM8809512.1 GuaB3 family IMP dehydrogenase-related protein [Candidatus Omnitrophota bacterium]MCM8810997.1 GuaB3 family IMP dehydrogenase-related protein [Candidatus Omnitrophota bacterium]
MAMWIGINRKARVCYGFDDISLVPGTLTINPEEVDITTQIGPFKLDIPIFAAAMDGVVDPKFALLFGKMGGIAVLNLMGIYTRYKDPYSVIEKIISSSPEQATQIIQNVYKEPVKENLIEERIGEIKKGNVICAVSCIPQYAERYLEIAQSSGVDIFVVQATVITVKHISTKYKPLDLNSFCKKARVPILVGNCVTFDVAYELMQTGISGLLVGIGPGAACTTREVLGIGVPQVTATADCAAARDFYFKKTGRYVPIITDGGMVTSGDVCKAFACGADAVMIGSGLVKAVESPGRGYHWGMATSDENLPRGTRIKVGTTGTLKEILFGPAKVDDGSQNLIGALKLSMACLGAKNIREMQLVEIAIAPSVKTEGKIYQSVKKLQKEK